MAPGLANQIIVWSYSNTDEFTLEECNWYYTESFANLHFSACQFIGNQLDLFYAEFSEWFNLAKFPDVEQQLQPCEKAVFLKAAGAPDDADFRSIENYDCFSGLRSIIRYRLDQRSLEQIKLAAELFNWTIDFGLFLCDTKASAVIRIGSLEEVGPSLLERILSRLPDENERGHRAHGDLSGAFEQRFLPLVQVLKMLKETVESSNWVQNQLALRLFFWIAEMYKAEVETEAG
jgi:hypothetical protein